MGPVQRDAGRAALSNNWGFDLGGDTVDEESLFAAALERSSPSERAAFLDQACADDRQLRVQVEALLRAHDNPDSFLDRPILGDQRTQDLAAATDRDDPRGVSRPARAEISLDFLEPCDAPGRLGKLGPYEVIEVLGRGGMGLVLKAHDPKLNRTVAIKTLAPELAANPTARKRFLREAQAAAAVSHPHVVTIHAVDEAGNTPYLVMECIAGVTLQEKIERVGTLDLREILRIGSQTAAGLAAAHAQGLIHRDVKPGNVLLENSVERVRVSDFGLARAVDDVSVTRTGEVSGTPQHMSPEQAQGQPLDQRSDLFSLGSVLYAMCTGRSPFRADTALATMRRVCDDTPRPIREINQDIPQGVVAIIDRLLAKDPDDRFQTAQEVADLLGRYLAHLQHPASTSPPEVPGLKRGADATVAARVRARATRRPKARRWSRPAVLAAASVLLLACVALGVTEATGITHFAATILRITTGTGTLVVEVDDPGVSVTIDGEDLVITGAGPQEVRLKPGQYHLQATKDGKRVGLNQELVTITRGGKQVIKVSLEHAQGSTPRTGAIEAGWVSLFNGRDLTGWKTHPDCPGGWTVEDGVLVGRSDPPRYLFSERGDYEDFHLRVEAKINDCGDSGVFFRAGYGVGFRPPSAYHGFPRGYEATILARPGIPTGSLAKATCPLSRCDELLAPHETWFTLEVIVRDSHIVVKVNDKVTVDYVDNDEPYREGHLVLQAFCAGAVARFRKIEIKELPPGDVDEAVPAPSLPSDYEVRRYVGHTAGVDSVCVSADGKRILSGGEDRTVRLWDLATGAELRRFDGHSQLVRSVAFLPDGRRLVSGSFDRTVRIWDAQTGQQLHGLTGHRDQVWSVSALPDGKRVVSASFDKTVRVWDIDSGQQVGMLQLEQPVCSVAALPDGRHVLCGDKAGIVQLWDLDKSSLVRRFEGHTDHIKGLAVSPEGRRALSAGAMDGTARLWDLQTGKELRRFEGHGDWAHGGAFSRDGKLALTGGSTVMFLWDLETGRRLRTFRAPCHFGISSAE